METFIELPVKSQDFYFVSVIGVLHKAELKQVNVIREYVEYVFKYENGQTHHAENLKNVFGSIEDVYNNKPITTENVTRTSVVSRLSNRKTGPLHCVKDGSYVAVEREELSIVIKPLNGILDNGNMAVMPADEGLIVYSSKELALINCKQTLQDGDGIVELPTLNEMTQLNEEQNKLVKELRQLFAKMEEAKLLPLYKTECAQLHFMNIEHFSDYKIDFDDCDMDGMVNVTDVDTEGAIFIDDAFDGQVIMAKIDLATFEK